MWLIWHYSLYCVPVLLTHIHKLVADTSLWMHSDHFEREDLGWRRRHVSRPGSCTQWPYTANDRHKTKVKYCSFRVHFASQCVMLYLQQYTVERRGGSNCARKNNHGWCENSLGRPWHFLPCVYARRWNFSVPLDTGLHRVRLIRVVKESWREKADRARASSVPPGFCQLPLSHLQNTAFDRNVFQ